MLTDVQIRKAKPTDKPYRLPDGGGLHLFVTPAGGRHWRLRYEFGGREKLLSIGPYPAIGLAAAREARDEAKALLRAGRDPSIAKQLRRSTVAGDTFEAQARAWHARQAPAWSERHAGDVLKSLVDDVFPLLGAVRISDITPAEALAVLRPIEERGAVETARRVRQRMSGVFVHAIASGVCVSDPAAIVQAAMAPLIKGRQPAITNLDDARQVLADAEATAAHPLTKLALRLLAITAVRPGALIGTPWSEFAALDPVAPIWTIPAERMKLRRQHKTDATYDHLVPLPRQAVETIKAAWRLSGRGPLVFPSTRSAHRPMSENAIGYLLNRAGYHSRHVPHGWRSTFSTVMNERFRGDRQVIDLMLAHAPKERVEAAYNRAEHMARRRELAEIWADLIMAGRAPAEDLLGLPRR